MRPVSRLFIYDISSDVFCKAETAYHRLLSLLNRCPAQETRLPSKK